MGVSDVEQAKRRLQDILRRAHQLEIPAKEIISTRTARKLLARTKNALVWAAFVGILAMLLTGIVYVRWPTQEVETVRTVFRRTCGASPSGEFSDRIAILLRSSSTQDDC